MLRLPETERFDIAGRSVILTHGHHFNIYRNQDAMFYYGEENQADIVMFGHIHIPVVATNNRVTIVNPGSLSLPRQPGSEPTYIVMTVEEGREPDYKIKYM